MHKSWKLTKWGSTGYYMYTFKSSLAVIVSLKSGLKQTYSSLYQ